MILADSGRPPGNNELCVPTTALPAPIESSADLAALRVSDEWAGLQAQATREIFAAALEQELVQIRVSYGAETGQTLTKAAEARMSAAVTMLAWHRDRQSLLEQVELRLCELATERLEERISR